MQAASGFRRDWHGVVAKGTAVALVLSWIGLLGVSQIASWGLAPYDTTPLELRPDVGRWERQASDFFGSPPGNYLVGAVVVGISVALFAFAWRQAKRSADERARIVAAFFLSNLIVGGAALASGFVMASLPLELAPYPGYGWTVKFLAPEMLLLAVLLALQAFVIPRRLLARR